MKKPFLISILLSSILLNSCTKETIIPQQNNSFFEQNITSTEKDLIVPPYTRVIGEIGKAFPEKEITINGGIIENDILYLFVDHPNLRNLQFQAIGHSVLSKTDPPQRLVTIKYIKSESSIEYGGLQSTILAIEIKNFRVPEQVSGTVVLNINKSLLSFTYNY